MNPDLATALQALANQYNVILAVQVTPETPEAELPAAPADASTGDQAAA
jgi:hypothetical protein